MTDKIYAPNIHLFAFHLRHGFKPDAKPFDVSPDWLENKYGEILKNFDIHKPVELRTDIPKANTVNLLKEAQNNGKSFANLGKGTTPKNGNNTPIEIVAVACPLQIEDSYALTLNIRRPQNLDNDAVEIERLKDFNPQECFLPHYINSLLGQTILITAFLDEQEKHQNLKSLQNKADECVCAFIHETDKSKCPTCYQAGELFGSPIFEYRIANEDTTDAHILVWFFLEEATSKKFIQRYVDFIDLFLYRHKITTAYKTSRQEYDLVYQQIGILEDVLGEFKQKYGKKTGEDKQEILADADLKELNIKLKKLLAIALEYSQGIRNLEYCRNTAKINTRNYKQKVKEIQDLSAEDTSFLRSFAEKESEVFQEQIEADLGYFVHGSNLLDKAIASIRGMVEIDQAERDRSLERTIQIVGVGLGTGSLVGSATGHIDKVSAPQGSPSFPLHPFFSSLLWSLLTALVFGGLTWWLTRSKRRG
jgi:hypothetical protein